MGKLAQSAQYIYMERRRRRRHELRAQRAQGVFNPLDPRELWRVGARRRLGPLPPVARGALAPSRYGPMASRSARPVRKLRLDGRRTRRAVLAKKSRCARNFRPLRARKFRFFSHRGNFLPFLRAHRPNRRAPRKPSDGGKRARRSVN